MKHKVVRIKNLMYDGCEDHYGCVVCSLCVPLHCYTEEQFKYMDCKGLDELTFDIPKGETRYARDMRRVAELLKIHGEVE